MKPSVAVTNKRLQDKNLVGSKQRRAGVILILWYLILNTKKTKSGSSVWLEHYTDNVGVSSSNLLRTTG